MPQNKFRGIFWANSLVILNYNVKNELTKLATVNSTVTNISNRTSMMDMTYYTFKKFHLHLPSALFVQLLFLERCSATKKVALGVTKN